MSLVNHNCEKVVFVGGGFAGLTAALQLSRKKDRPQIILIEPRSRFIFLPLLYELLSGELRLWEVAPTYKSLLNGKGIVHIQEEAKCIDIENNQVTTSSGLSISYSEIVIASGSKMSSFGIPGVEQYALGFSCLEDVGLIKTLINQLNSSKISVHPLFIVGAGATGIELACKLSDLLEHKVDIHLVELGDSILSNGKSYNQSKCEAAINKRKIKVHLTTSVIKVGSGSLLLEKNKKTFEVPCRSVIWTAGTKGVLPLCKPELPNLGGKILVDNTFRVRELENVFAIGDVASTDDVALPATAQVAIQQGYALALNLLHLRRGLSLQPFHYDDMGEMLSLGMGDATITAKGLTLTGPVAFSIRRMTYLTKMPSLSLGIRSAGAWFLGKKRFNPQ